jgi:hypothetical protein
MVVTAVSHKQGRVNGLSLRVGIVTRMLNLRRTNTIRELERLGFVPRPRLLANTHHTFGGYDRRYSPLEVWVLVQAARDCGYPMTANKYQWHRAIAARQAYAKVHDVTAQEADMWVRNELTRLGLVNWPDTEDEEIGVTPGPWREREAQSPIPDSIQDRMPGSWANDPPGDAAPAQETARQGYGYGYHYGRSD